MKVSSNEVIITEKLHGGKIRSEHFRLLSQCFRKSSAGEASESVNMWKKVKNMNRDTLFLQSYVFRLLWVLFIIWVLTTLNTGFDYPVYGF